MTHGLSMTSKISFFLKEKPTSFLRETPLHLAAAKGHLDVVRVLIDSGVGKETGSSMGRTPLHLAASHGHMEVVLFLLESGVDKDSDGPNMWLPNIEVTPLVQIQ